MTEIQISDDFDLDKLAESGQCFRWRRTTKGGYRIVHQDHCLTIWRIGAARYRLSCTEAELERIWRAYFDLDTNYRAIRLAVKDTEDPFLARACTYGAGIRILRQEPWETLVSFIISQNRSIPMIQRSIELLCTAAGEERRDSFGEPYYTFPTPERLLALPDEVLAQCRLGYRCGYVRAAAEAVASGGLDLVRLAAEDAADSDVMAALTGVYGVGVKVASCVALFGLHRLDAFPVDVWVRRVLVREYPQGWPMERYRPYNGVYQQYLFFYDRSLHKA